jgi:hypothetical protein
MSSILVPAKPYFAKSFVATLIIFSLVFFPFFLSLESSEILEPFTEVPAYLLVITVILKT